MHIVTFRLVCISKSVMTLARTLALLLASTLFRISVTFGHENFSSPDQRPPTPSLHQQRQFLYDQLFESITSTGQQQLPFIQCCCHPDELYKPGIDYCKNESSIVFGHNVQQQPTLPSLIEGDATDGEISIATLMLTLNGQRNNNKTSALLRRTLKPCPDGYIARTSQRFQLFQNFSMKTEQGLLFPASEYCIYPAAGSYNSSKAAAVPLLPEYAVRYCVHAECDHVRPCIRKCCPMGMAVNLDGKECELNDEPFNDETVHRMLFNSIVQASGSAGAAGQEENSRMKIVDGYGFGMHCYDEASNMMELDEFRILPNGQMYAPEYPYRQRATYQYCVDHFVYSSSSDNAQNNSNQIIQMKGLRCFPEYVNLNAVKANQLAHSIYPYLLLVSSLFLFFTFVVYAFLASDILNAHGLIVMCYVASMAVLYACLGIFQLQLVVPQSPVDPGYTCIGLAVVTHFFFLATFSWLHVMCFDIWRTFRKSTPKPFNRRVGTSFIAYSIVGWGYPFLIVLTGQVFDRIVQYRGGNNSVIQPLFGEGQSCWFNEWKSIFLYLYGPVAVIILANVSFFTLTAVQLCRTRKDSALALGNQQTQNHITRQRIRVIFSLFILMGVTWSMEVISFAVGGSYVVWYIFDVLNIFTGVFVFIIFVCKKKVWKMLKKKFKFVRRLNCCCPNKPNAALERASRTSKQSFCRHQSQHSSVSTPSQLYYLKTNDFKTKLSARKSVDEEDTCI